MDRASPGYSRADQRRLRGYPGFGARLQIQLSRAQVQHSIRPGLVTRILTGTYYPYQRPSADLDDYTRCYGGSAGDHGGSGNNFSAYLPAIPRIQPIDTGLTAWMPERILDNGLYSGCLGSWNHIHAPLGPESGSVLRSYHAWSSNALTVQTTTSTILKKRWWIDCHP